VPQPFRSRCISILFICRVLGVACSRAVVTLFRWLAPPGVPVYLSGRTKMSVQSSP
jgi:hypothetical protein